MTRCRVSNVLIVFGGRSVEHNVSIESVRGALPSIKNAGYNTKLWYISSCGGWMVGYHIDDILSTTVTVQKYSSACEVIEFIKDVDIVFPIIHGRDGEDGSIQGFFQLFGKPVIGASILGSAICLDKVLSKQVAMTCGIPVTPYIYYDRRNISNISYRKICAKLGKTLCVKPNSLGSSIGVNIVNSEEELERSIQLVFQFDEMVLIEKAINGREISCGIIGKTSLISSVVGEVYVDGVYSYDKKYDNKSKKLLIPADIDASISKSIREQTVYLCNKLRVSGMARVDYFMLACGSVLFNEVNTIPSIDKDSMFSSLWAATGINSDELFRKIIDNHCVTTYA